MKSKIPSFLLNPVRDQLILTKGKSTKLSFLDRTILSSVGAVKAIYLQAENAANENIIQKIHPHVKFLSLIYLAIVISIVRNPFSQLLISTFIFLLYLLSQLRVFEVYRKIFYITFIFGFLVALPASLNLITPGKIILNLFTFDKSFHFWIYNIPQNIGFTENGIHVVSLFFLRVLNSVSLSLLIVFTTPFASFIKSFKLIGVPDTFMMIISLAYKYIFILSRTIEDTYFALKSRLTGNINNRNARILISGRIFFIFKKSMIIYENTYFAMISRGYTGSVKLHSKNNFTKKDLVALVFIIAFGLVIILL